MSEQNFLTQLRQSAVNSKSLICFGMDPVIEALPEELREKGISGFAGLMMAALQEMKNKKVSPAMFKPNFAWWFAHDEPLLGVYRGSDALKFVINSIRGWFPGIPVTKDSKDGDIGTSSTKWAIYGYEKWGADAITVHPYMGSDSVGPFISYCNNEKGKGAYILVKTTNKGASDLELRKMADGKFVYEFVAEHVINWAMDRPGVGAVTAGNSPEELAVLGKMFAGKDIPLLIPGVGPSQGGDAGQVSQILYDSGYDMPLARINLSSGITHSWYQPGKENPRTKECVDIIVDTVDSLNQKTFLWVYKTLSQKN